MTDRIHTMTVIIANEEVDLWTEETDGEMGPVHLAYGDAMAGTPTLAWLKENLPNHIFHGADDE